MSFFDHLEELRTALMKSILALVLGTLVGLLLGWSVVDYIQTPLREALVKFYQGQAREDIVARLNQMESEGTDVPEDIEGYAKSLAEDGMAPQDFYFDADELRRALKLELPAKEPAEGVAPRETMIRLRGFKPLEDDPRLNLISTAGHEPFMVYVKASLVVGAMIASPFIFFFIWDFVAAGLYNNERKYVYLFLPISLGLFFAGAALAFFLVFDFVLEFLFWFNDKMGINPTPRINEWMSFVLILPLGFGVSFQLPLVMLFLERIGIFTVDVYLKKWRVAVLVIAVLSMFLTPADPGSMMLMAVPLVVLYFGGILMCHFMPRPTKSTGDGPKEDKSSG
ncbi:MAG: twin-arginine translocase subunit TatC [Planctomycetes bacterium]|nr:twin-arginine translocase subunit TatC [Planctomycetota bacterium]